MLLAFLVLSAAVPLLSAGLASGYGEELPIERLVVFDLSGKAVLSELIYASATSFPAP